MDTHNRTLLTVVGEAALEKKLVADLEALGAPGCFELAGLESDSELERAWRMMLNLGLEEVGLRGARPWQQQPRACVRCTSACCCTLLAVPHC